MDSHQAMLLQQIDSNSALRHFPSANTPRQEIEYCDERLKNLNVAFWTEVEVTNDFAARVISLYLRTDHPLLGLFSPNLFIADLVGKRERFCSRFLFHTLMYLGSVSGKPYWPSASCLMPHKLMNGERSKCTVPSTGRLFQKSRHSANRRKTFGSTRNIMIHTLPWRVL